MLVTLSLVSSLFLPSCISGPSPDDDRVILGIFGGMGPEATADLYLKIIRLTPADKDQDHIPTLIYSLPQVPDRMASIRSGNDSILVTLREGVQKLEAGGADFIAIPCNTVHYYYPQMQAAVKIPILNMIEEAAKEAEQKYAGNSIVGLLATSGTIATGLYEDALGKRGFRVVVPPDSIQEGMVMNAVFGIKAGTNNQVNEDLLTEAALSLIRQGAEILVLGCTEIPLAFNPDRVDVPVVDATRVLAERSVTLYREMLTGKDPKP